MIIDNIDPKTVRGSVGLMLREERLARGLSFEQAAADGFGVNVIDYHF